MKHIQLIQLSVVFIKANENNVFSGVEFYHSAYQLSIILYTVIDDERAGDILIRSE